MKRFTFILPFLFLLSVGLLPAQQFSLQLIMSPNPSPYLSDWEERTETVTLVITNLTPQNRQVQVKARILEGGNLRAETKTPDMPAINVEAQGVQEVGAESVIPIHAIQLYGTSETAIVQTGKIPAGSYQLCVTLLDAQNGNLVSQEVCQFFTATSYNAPVLILPPDEQNVQSTMNSNILFSWTPVTPSFPGPFSYLLQVFEILSGQDAIQAFQANQPIVEEEIVGATQTFWPNDVDYPDCGDYIWSVRVLDDAGRPITDPDGYADPYVFTVVCEDDVVVEGEEEEDDIVTTTEEEDLTGETKSDMEKDTVIIRNPDDGGGTPLVPTIVDTGRRENCFPTDPKSDPGAPISLGMTVDKPELVPYPRAVPVRAAAEDKDYAIFRCTDCSGITAEDWVPVPDKIERYKWELSGLGSLNTPFDLDAIKKLDDSLKTLNEELGMVEDSLKQMAEEIEKIKKDLEKKKELAKKQLPEMEKAKSNLDTALASQRDSVTTATDSIAEYLTERKNATDTIDQHRDTIDVRIDSIKAVTGDLRGDPRPAEQAKMAELKSAREDAEDADSALVRKEREIQSEATRLDKEVAAKGKALTEATDAYLRKKEEAEHLGREIIRLRATLYGLPKARAFFSAQRSFDMAVNALLNSRFSSEWDAIHSSHEAVSDAAETALSVVPPAERTASLADFRTVSAALLTLFSDGCDALAEPEKSDCASDLTSVIDASGAYDLALADLLSTPFVLDLGLLARIRGIQGSLGGKEAGVRAAEREVKKKGRDYQTAMKDRIRTIKKLETSRDKLSTAKNKAWIAMEAIETAWRAMVADREEQLELNREEWIKRLNRYETDRDSLSREINRLRDSVAQRDKDTSRLNEDIERFKRKIESLEEEKKDLVALIDELKRILGLKPEDAVAEEEKEKKRLEEREKKLNDDIERLKKEREELGKGKKSAEGPIVYYIPPPLEEIMKDEEEFNRLRDSVEAREADLAKAEGYRRGSQGRQARILDKIARELSAMKEAEHAIKELGKEIDSLQTELDKVRNKKTQEYSDQQEELQNVLTRTEKQREEIRRKKKEAEAEKAKSEAELKKVRTQLENLYRSYKESEEELKTFRSQHDFELTARERLGSGLETSRAKLKKEKELLLILEDKLAQTTNEVARTIAREDVRSEASATAKVTSASSAVEAQQVKVASLETDVTTKAASLVTAEQRVQAAETSLKSAEKTHLSIRNDIRIAEEKLAKANEQLESDLNGVNHWVHAEATADQLIDKTNEARREFQGVVADKVNSEEDVKARAKEIAELKKEVEEKKTRLKKGSAEIAAAMDKKKEEETTGKDTVKVAKENLVKAEEELRLFLVDEFKHVDFSAELTATAYDAGMDKYRVKEGSTRLKKKITYGGKRVPTFPNQLPSSKLANRKVPGPCIPEVSFMSPGPIGPGPQEIEKEEPRTIALIYKRGEPIWKEWPVIADTVPVLSQDVIELSTSGTDSDTWKQVCVSDAQICPPLGSLGGSIKDLVTFTWKPDDQFVNGNAFAHVLWEALEVEKPDCDKTFKVSTIYAAAGVSGDAVKSKEMELAVKPGVMIEIPDSLLGAPKGKEKFRVRIVTGDHKGLAGETIELKVKKTAGEAEKFGLDGTTTTVTRTTDENGYVEVEFNFGEGFAEFEVSAAWKRPTVCVTNTFKAITPLYLHIPLFTKGGSAVAWEGAKKVWGGAGAEGVLGSMPAYVDSLYGSEIYAVAGHYDEDIAPVNDLAISFHPKTAGISVVPPSDSTELFGIARTTVKDAPEESAVEITARCAPEYKPVGRPDEIDGEYNTSTIKEFKIGDKSDLFAIVPEEPVSRGELINGVGVLKGTTKGAFIKIFNGVELTITGVEVEDEGGTWVAKKGTVSWNVGEKKLEKSLSNFTIGLDSLVIRAQKGAGIGGRVKHTSLESPVNFYAEMNTKGEFFGEVTSLPEIEVAKFKLKKGASFAIDMHNSKSEPGFASTFRGIVIRQASLQLPPVFNGTNGAPSTLIAKDFAISSSGFEGSLSLTGSFLTLGYAGYQFQADSVGLEFKASRLTGGGFRGALALASPMEGKLVIGIGRSGDKWQGTISTENPVSIPRLKTTFSIGSGTGITWDETKKLGTLKLNGTINSPKFGDIEIKGFEFNSRGEIKLEKMAVGKAITIADRFSLKLDHLSFVAMDGEYGLSLKGGLEVPSIGVDKLSGTVTISPGPKLSFTFDSAKVHFERGPVEFAGMFSWGGKEFRGDFDVGIKKLGKGITGMFIVGSTQDESEKNYTYWYAEMSLKTAIAMGQTGLAMTEIGGGVGWNYHPPVGLQEGTPKKSDAFSFKAILGVGNVAVPLTSSGNVFAGRMTMVLVPGRFTINGKAWLLGNEESMFGEGQLNLRWAPVAKMDGYVRMLVGLPDAEGEIFDFAGKVNFLYKDGDGFIKSEYIHGSVMKKVNASATIDITKEEIDLAGKVWYDLNREYSALGVGLKLDLNVSSEQGVNWKNVPKKLDARLDLAGKWDVNITLPVFGTYDLASGGVGLKAHLKASPSHLSFAGKVYVSWNLLGYRGSKWLDVGYSTGI